VFSLRGSNSIVVRIFLCIVVLIGVSCASGAPSPTPLPMTTTTSALLSTPTQGTQAPTSAVSPMPFAMPELPSKGSPDAKVTLVMFTGYH
jgi:hypothetical protein